MRPIINSLPTIDTKVRVRSTNYLLLFLLGLPTLLLSQEYKIVTIADLEWMTENLNIEVEGSCCYNNNPDNCEKFGRLYTWEGAMNACPEGWHLPSDAEWRQTIDHLGGDKIAHDRLKIGGDSGFNAVMGGGIETEGSHMDLNIRSFYWTSTDLLNDYAWYYYFYLVDYDTYGESPMRLVYNKRGGGSVRCVKNTQK